MAVAKGKRTAFIEEVYVAARIAGDSPAEAYLKANPGASKHMMKRVPYQMDKRPRVAALMAQQGFKPVAHRRVHILMQEAKDAAQRIKEAGMSRAEKRLILKKIANDPKASKQHRIMAIQTDNLMTGDNKPVRFEGEVTLHSIMKALDSSTSLPAPNELIELDPITQ